MKLSAIKNQIVRNLKGNTERKDWTAKDKQVRTVVLLGP